MRDLFVGIIMYEIVPQQEQKREKEKRKKKRERETKRADRLTMIVFDVFKRSYYLKIVFHIAQRTVIIIYYY